MTSLAESILSCIGNTSLLPLRRIAAGDSARVLLKIESENPTGSMKDRMALAMVEAAEADGRLTTKGVVEYTTGNTGVALALICAVKGYPLHIVTSDAYAPEKRDHMAILGPTLHVLRSEGGRMTERLTRDMIEAARTIAKRSGAYWTDQLRNADQLPAFHVEPAESPVLSGGSTGAHQIDGMGAGFVVPLWQPELATGVEQVSTEEAFEMSLRLAREEGLFGGATTGANVVAAVRVAKRLGRGATVVTILCDAGTKYLRVFGPLTNPARTAQDVAT